MVTAAPMLGFASSDGSSDLYVSGLSNGVQRGLVYFPELEKEGAF